MFDDYAAIAGRLGMVSNYSHPTGVVKWPNLPTPHNSHAIKRTRI